MDESNYLNNFTGSKQSYTGYKFTKDQKKWSVKKRKRWYLYHVKGITTCAICGKFMSWDNTSLEHITPISKGGTADFSNLSLSHIKCNHKRGNSPLGLLKRVMALKPWFEAPVIKEIKVTTFIKEF